MTRRAAIQYALLIVFFLVPAVLINFGPRYVPLSIEVFIALVVASILTGVPAVIFFALAVAMNLRRRGRPVDIGYLRREHRFTALASLLLVITATFTLAVSFTPAAPVYVALALAYALVVLPVSARHHQFRAAILVDCAPQEAFDFVTDPRNVSRYLPQVEVVGQVDLPLHVGSTIRYRVHEASLVLEADETVTDIAPNLRFATALTPMSRGVYTFTPADGGTEIAYSYTNVVSVSQAVLGAAVDRRGLERLLISRRMEGMRRLKDILEAQAPVSV